MVLKGIIRPDLLCITRMDIIIMVVHIIVITVISVTIMHIITDIIMATTMADRCITIRTTGQCRTLNAER